MELILTGIAAVVLWPSVVRYIGADPFSGGRHRRWRGFETLAPRAALAPRPADQRTGDQRTGDQGTGDQGTGDQGTGVTSGSPRSPRSMLSRTSRAIAVRVSSVPLPK